MEIEINPIQPLSMRNTSSSRSSLTKAFLFSRRHPIEGWLGNIQVTVFNNGDHFAEEEGEDQRADMSTIYVGIGHDDDFMIAQFLISNSLSPIPVPSAVIILRIS